MTSIYCLLLAAGLDPAVLPDALDPAAQQSLRGILPILIATTAVVIGFIAWAVFVRRSPKYLRKGALLDEPTESGGRNRRRKRRRREHRSRNPTRAEAGGLPPPGAGGSDPTLL